MNKKYFVKAKSWVKVVLPLYLLALLPIFSACEDILETESDRQIFDPGLDQKTDSMFYTLGILKGVQQVADQYVMTGEMRGDLVATNQHTETDLRRLADFTADATNRYDSAYLYYRIINNCNYYIAHRDTSLRTGSRQVAIPELAEAYAVRAWAYLQLGKNYGTVPFYTDPIVSIGEANRIGNDAGCMKDLQGICDALAPKLMEFSGTPVPTYGNISAGILNSSDGEGATDKTVSSRLAMIPVDVVLGDLFLETHQYEKAAYYYFTYLQNNKIQAHQAYIEPISSISLSELLIDRLPANLSITAYPGDYAWQSIFRVNSTNDIITYIPMAANRLRGVVTELPRYFGYDFYTTTVREGSSDRYLLERQIDPSAPYIALSNAQEYYYLPDGLSAGDNGVRSADAGDLRRYITMQQVAKDDSAFAVMIKFNNANIPLYRISTVYLRLAEAINRMEYPHVAFAILKDGIRTDMMESMPSYFNEADTTFLLHKVPFFAKEHIEKFNYNWGIHSRGAGYTRGDFSPYQLDTIVGMKLKHLNEQFGLGLTEYSKQDSINAIEDLICDEMALELAYEGCRFGDLTRIARHKNHAGLYGGNFGSQWLADKLAYKEPKVSLLDEKNWYLKFK